MELKKENQPDPKEQKFDPVGRPEDGRPKNAKDQTKRKQREVKPVGNTEIVTMSMWASDAQAKISETVNPAILAHYDKKSLRELRRKMQIIFQDPYASLNPRMTIGNAIMEPMQVHNILASDDERKEKVKKLLSKVSLDPSHFYRYPHEFSGGQRQRIGIARALAVDPKFIICDESVSALDVSVQAQVLNLLNDLKDEFGLTYIFISHDLSVVKYMSDRMVVMQEGKVEEMGDADQIYNSPKTEYTNRLIDAIPEGKLEDIKAHLEKKGVVVN